MNLKEYIVEWLTASERQRAAQNGQTNLKQDIKLDDVRIPPSRRGYNFPEWLRNYKWPIEGEFKDSQTIYTKKVLKQINAKDNIRTNSIISKGSRIVIFPDGTFLSGDPSRLIHVDLIIYAMYKGKISLDENQYNTFFKNPKSLNNFLMIMGSPYYNEYYGLSESYSINSFYKKINTAETQAQIAKYAKMAYQYGLKILPLHYRKIQQMNEEQLERAYKKFAFWV
jgi:hypothetical protein